MPFTNQDGTMLDTTTCTYAKVKATAEAGPTANMRVGAVRGVVTSISDTATAFMLGVIGIPTAV
jgi:hypothetical protein